MAKYCPVRERYVLYLDCMECEEKECASPKHPTVPKDAKQNDTKDSFKKKRN